MFVDHEQPGGRLAAWLTRNHALNMESASAGPAVRPGPCKGRSYPPGWLETTRWIWNRPAPDRQCAPGRARAV